MILICFSLILLEIPGQLSASIKITASTDQVTNSLHSYRILQYQLPNGSSQPWGIATDSLGRVWFVEERSNQIGMFDPKTKNFTEYIVTTPNSLLEEISIDSGGNPWFTELNGEHLGELNVSTGQIVEFPIPERVGNLACGPIGVTARAESIWITCEFSNQIDEFFPRNSSFESYSLPIFYSAPLEIAFDSTGNFWFTAADSNMLGYATVSALKTGTGDGIEEFPPKNSSYLTSITSPQPPPGFGQKGNTIVSGLETPSQLALSPDGKILWITEHVSSSFDEYDISAKILDKYWTSQTHNPNYTNSLPNGIAIDNTGIVWIAEHYGNKIAEYDPASKTMIEYPIPCCGSELAGTLYLALGKNSTVWFTEFYGNRIGELVPTNQSESISISLENDALSLAKGSSGYLPIIVSNNAHEAQRVTMDLSGLSQSGTMPNGSVAFTPSNLVIPAHGSALTELGIRSKNLKIGDYYLTLGIRSNDTEAVYSTIISLTVGGSRDYSSLITDWIIVGMVVAFTTIGSLTKILRKRPKPNSKFS